MKSLEELRKEYEDYKARGLKLDMSRGKPCREQLELSMPMLDTLDSKSVMAAEDGTDTRNYGVLFGIPECRALMGEMLGVPADNVVVFGNSSLNVMFDVLGHAFHHGIMGGTPWCRLEKPVKWLCVVPGYDRHFGVSQYWGCENVCVNMLLDGPDMGTIEELVASDEMIKGIWCVPKYSNPTGNSYSDEVVRRMARLKPAAKDFRIFWDNAYGIHHLYDDNRDEILDIISECAKAGNPDMVYEFASTSKISFPGAGVACMAASAANIEDFKKQMNFQTIGHDKINQLRHVKYFRETESLDVHMRRHANILRPKFQMVANIFDDELFEIKNRGLVRWTVPKGGYFISLDVPKGCAKKVVKLCADAGVKLTGAGATYPGGYDPEDRNIRIAPSFPPLDELETATRLLCLCVQLCVAEQDGF